MKNFFKPLLLIGCLGLGFTVTRAPFEEPGPPGIPVVIDIQADECTIKYEKPKRDGGSPITGYLIESQEKWSFRWIDRGATSLLEHKIANLREGTDIRFRVKASNAAGFGPASDPCNYVTIRPRFNN